MPEKFRKSVVLLKGEATYGVDATPTGAANAIMASEPEVTPLEGDTVSRNLLFPELGASPQIQVGSHVSCRFGVEMAGGGGAVDLPPPYGPALIACAMAETVNVAVSVVYDPVSANEGSSTIYFHKDGTLHKLLGARGNVRAVVPANGVPHFMFEFRGLWADPAAAALPTADFTAFTDPLPVSNANTPTFTLHAFAAVLQSLELDLGNAIVHRDRVNSETVALADRQGSGSCVIEAPSVAAKNYFTTIKTSVLDALALVHGTLAGNIVKIDAPKVQLLNPTYGNDDGINMLNMGLVPTRDTGDDDIKITVQ